MSNLLKKEVCRLADRLSNDPAYTEAAECISDYVAHCEARLAPKSPVSDELRAVLPAEPTVEMLAIITRKGDWFTTTEGGCTARMEGRCPVPPVAEYEWAYECYQNLRRAALKEKS